MNSYSPCRCFAGGVVGLSLIGLLMGPVGCCSRPGPDLVKMRAGWTGSETRDLTLPYYNSDVHAVCDPPIGWKPKVLKVEESDVHQTWVSPTGETAYGVIHFKMPLPVGSNLALSGFLDQMEETEGKAKLLEQHDDPNLPGIRFIAEGKQYTLRANLIVDGWEGWAVFAGTALSGQIIPNELDTAVRAREHTRVGKPENSGE